MHKTGTKVPAVIRYHIFLFRFWFSITIL